MRNGFGYTWVIACWSTKGAYDTFICADCGQGILRRNWEKLGAMCAGIHIYII